MSKQYTEYHPITGWKQTRDCDEAHYMRNKQRDRNVIYKKYSPPKTP